MSSKTQHPNHRVKKGESGMPAGATETLYRYLIEGVTEYAIFAVSTTGEVLSWNAGAEHCFGYASKEIIGKNYEVFFTAEDRALGAPAAELKTAAAEGRADNDRWHVRRDGTKFWGTNTVQPLADDSTGLTGFTKIVRDTTEQYEAAQALQRSEERLRLLIESVTDYAIYSTSVDGTITLWNAGAEKMFGYTAAEIIGTSYARLFTKSDIDLDIPRHNLDEATDRGTTSDERWLIRKEGTRFYAGVSLTRIKDDPTGGRPGFISIAHDITLRKQFEDNQKGAAAELGRARDDALQAAKLKSQFVATMSHEIRTPISGVIGMTELLLLTPLNGEQRESANVIHNSGQSLLRVINNILDFSKLEAGKVELESIEFELESTIASVIDPMQVQFDEKNVTLTSQIDSHLPNRLIGDLGRVEQVLTNLVGNALKFTAPNGHVRIAVVTMPGEDAGVKIRFEVQDDGIGIDPDVQRQLFQPFTQGDGSTTRKFGGTGLGLSICKQLVDLMGGAIGVDSAPSKGATFWFVLSFAASNAAVGVPGIPVFKGAAKSKIQPRTENVLLAEDNDVNRLLAERQFAKLGFQLTSVVNGRDVVEAVQHTQFDAVFMDCHMPEMDGFQATKKIRTLEKATTKRLPIIAMTADAQIDDRKLCLAAGMDDYISKPASLSNLRAVLARWLPERGV